jgi:uncharacterized protein (UPF0333 family)
MTSVKKNEHGVGLVEGVLIVVIIAAIGFVGWYVYKHRSTTTKPVASTTASSTTSSPAPLPSGTSNAALQSDLSNVTNTSNQSAQDMSATNNSLNDQSTMTSVPQ